MKLFLYAVFASFTVLLFAVSANGQDVSLDAVEKATEIINNCGGEPGYSELAMLYSLGLDNDDIEALVKVCTASHARRVSGAVFALPPVVIAVCAAAVIFVTRRRKFATSSS